MEKRIFIINPHPKGEGEYGGLEAIWRTSARVRTEVEPPWRVVDVPPQILLFLANLWDYADGDEALFREEVRTTYLHELGHYLGLDELDLEERGLE